MLGTPRPNNALQVIALVLGFALLVVAAIGLGDWLVSFHLPSDQKAARYFQGHRAQFTALAARVTNQLAASFSDRGANGEDAALLEGVGGQFLRRSDGTISIYVWGHGCAVCHDSYEGYICLPKNSRLLKGTSVVRALDHDLPRDGRGGVEDGFYILPLSDDWYVFKEENG